MNTTRRTLEILEPLLERRYWARLFTTEDHTFFEAGPIHDNGFEECPTQSGIVYEDGRVIVSERRI
jgi:hypothetical protein